MSPVRNKPSAWTASAVASGLSAARHDVVPADRDIADLAQRRPRTPDREGRRHGARRPRACGQLGSRPAWPSVIRRARRRRAFAMTSQCRLARVEAVLRGDCSDRVLRSSPISLHRSCRPTEGLAAEPRATKRNSVCLTRSNVARSPVRQPPLSMTTVCSPDTLSPVWPILNRALFLLERIAVGAGDHGVNDLPEAGRCLLKREHFTVAEHEAVWPCGRAVTGDHACVR